MLPLIAVNGSLGDLSVTNLSWGKPQKTMLYPVHGGKGHCNGNKKKCETSVYLSKGSTVRVYQDDNTIKMDLTGSITDPHCECQAVCMLVSIISDGCHRFIQLLYFICDGAGQWGDVWSVRIRKYRSSLRGLLPSVGHFHFTLQHFIWGKWNQICKSPILFHVLCRKEFQESHPVHQWFAGREQFSVQLKTSLITRWVQSCRHGPQIGTVHHCILHLLQTVVSRTWQRTQTRPQD